MIAERQWRNPRRTAQLNNIYYYISILLVLRGLIKVNARGLCRALECSRTQCYIQDEGLGLNCKTYTDSKCDALSI